jgi:hypothetical protein
LEWVAGDGGEVFKEAFEEANEGDAVAALFGCVEPFGEVQECLEWGLCWFKEHANGGGKLSAVGDEVPEAGEAADGLELFEGEESVAEDFPGRLSAPDHLPFGIVPENGSAAEAFEEADLNFLGPESPEAVEAVGEAVEIFSGESGDEIGMNVNAGFGAEPFEILFGDGIVLLTTDELSGFGIEGLDADFELEHAWWEAADDFAKGFRESIGDEFEVEEEVRGDAFEEEFEDGAADAEIEVEGAIDEFELSESAVEE